MGRMGRISYFESAFHTFSEVAKKQEKIEQEVEEQGEEEVMTEEVNMSARNLNPSALNMEFLLPRRVSSFFSLSCYVWV